MNTKWLRLYERVTLYGETLEVMDYSPEIDACLPRRRQSADALLWQGAGEK